MNNDLNGFHRHFALRVCRSGSEPRSPDGGVRLAVLELNQYLANQQDSFTVARASIALNLIATYRALGGGWEMRLARDGGHSVEPVAAPPGAAPAPKAEPLPVPGGASLPPGPSLQPPRMTAK